MRSSTSVTLNMLSSDEESVLEVDDSEEEEEEETVEASAAKAQKRGDSAKIKKRKMNKKKRLEEKKVGPNKRVCSPFSDADMVDLPPQVSTDSVSHESRLNTANSVLPFLLHCRWRRAVRRRRMTDQVTKTGALRPTPKGGIIRTVPYQSRQQNDISRKWRVSPLYVRKYMSTKPKVYDAYLHSTDRKMRMKYCTKIRRALIGDSPRDREGALLHRRPTCSISRHLNQPRTLCSPSPRGERDGLPAGPGLPHGESTGDDD